jgi:5-methylcytosine-specific restriction endonuclease McrA
MMPDATGLPQEYDAARYYDILTVPGEDRSFGGQRLQIELVPTTCWFTHVRSCVSKNDWRRIRATVITRAGGACEICGTRPPWFEVHERFEYDETARTQRLRRLLALCPDCSAVTHYGRARQRGFGEKALLAHLARVNGWTYRKALAHLSRTVSVWRERNTLTWELDISMIERAGITVAQPPDPQARADIASATLESRTAMQERPKRRRRNAERLQVAHKAKRLRTPLVRGKAR